MKQVIKNFVPPIFYPLYRRILARPLGHAHLSGFYKDWEEALQASDGYDSKQIFQNVCEAALKVQRGEALYERDSVCFYEEDYRWQTLAALLYVARLLEHKKSSRGISVLDFGGSLGSFYIQHRRFLDSFGWHVVEQEHFVDFGKENIKVGTLDFFYDIDEVLQKSNPDLLFLSSVLQYLESPYDRLEELLSFHPPYVIVDRTSFIEKPTDMLRVQNVPKSIYEAKYPIWFFSKERFLFFLKKQGYEIDFYIPDPTDWSYGCFMGFLARRVS